MCSCGKGFYISNFDFIIFSFDSTIFIFDSTIFEGPLFVPAGKIREDSNGDDCEGYGDDTVYFLLIRFLKKRGKLTSKRTLAH